MKRMSAVLTFVAVLGTATAQAGQVDLGISISDGRLRSFYVAVGDHYRMSPRAVVDLVNLRFLSEYHGIAPDMIIAQRSRGRSFIAIHDDVGRGRAKGPGPQEKGPKGGKPAKGKKK